MFPTYTNLAYKQELLQRDIPPIADNDNLINILLVEDDFSDALLTVQKIKATQVPYNLDRIMHGDDVLPYLRNCMQSRLPDIMILDMGLPGVNGFELLEALNEAPAALRAVPIVIITGYQHFDYLSATYNSLPIYGCLTKPLNVDDINPILAKVTDFKGE